MTDDRLFKFLLRCQRNYDEQKKRHEHPYLSSFWIDIDGGRAFVNCQDYTVYIRAEDRDGSIQSQWSGTAVAAANRLEMLGAVYETIDM